MKKIFASFGWLLILIPFISVAGTNTLLSVSSHRLDEEKRSISNFNGVASSGSFDVLIKMGNRETIRLEGDPEDIKQVETVVENGILKIRYKKSPSKWNFGNKGKINVYIVAKSLSSVSVSGSGDMEISGTLEAPKLDAAVSGSGSIKLDAISRTLNVSVSGSGDVIASGRVDMANVSISGSGEFRGKDLKAKTAQVKVSGSGEATIYANKTLNVQVSGSGNVFYAGSPDVNATRSGSGKVTKI